MSNWRDGAEVVEPNWRDGAEKVQPKIIQEMHPRISLKDRAIAKNFSQSQDKTIEFLKSQYPDMEFKFFDNNIIAKAPGDTDYKVLDPNTGFFSKDFLKDAADVAFDTGAGLVEGAATALGAVGGATLGGAGAIPGAMVAGASTSAANEALRQKLGQALGIPQNIDSTDVAISGGIGALSPALFGAGKARGAIKTGLDGFRSKVAPKIGSMMSGVRTETLKNYADDGIRATVDGLEKTGVDDFAGKAYDKISDYITTNKNRAGEELVQAIDQTGVPVNIAPAKGSFRAQEALLASQPNLTNYDKSRLNTIKSAYEKYFGLSEKPKDGFDMNTLLPIKASGEIPDQATAKRAWDLQKSLKQMAKFEQGMTPEDAYTKQVARDSYGTINKALDEASDGLTTKAKGQYKDAVTLENELLPKFEGNTRMDSIQKTYKELSNMDAKSRQILKERLSRLAESGQLDLTNESKVLGTFSELGNPKLMPISSGGTTSTTRSIPAAGIGGIVGAYGGNQAGLTGQPGADSALGAVGGVALGTLLGSPAAMKNYIRMTSKASNVRKAISPKSDAVRRGIRTGTWTELLKQTQED